MGALGRAALRLKKRTDLLRGDRPDCSVEIAPAAGALVLVDRALMLGRRQWQAHRHRREARVQRRFAGEQHFIEFLDAVLEAEERPGVGGAVLKQQEAALPPRE